MVKRILTVTLASLFLVYVGAIVFLRFKERQLVYLPGERVVAEPPSHFVPHFRSVTYPSTDGTPINAWVIPADSSDMWLLLCHGNYGNIGYGERPEFYASMRQAGLNIFAFDYRGFGASGGSPNEPGLYRDARASYAYLTDSLKVPPDRIVIFGHSLGSGVAIELATHVPAAALVVEGAYDTVPDIAQGRYPLMPIKWIATQRFPSIERIGRITIPKLFLHAEDDDAIPIAHGERLFAAAAEPREFVRLTGGHALSFRVDSTQYFGAVRALVARVTAK